MSIKTYNDNLNKIRVDEETKDGIVKLIDIKTDDNMEKVLAAIKSLEFKLETRIGLVETKLDTRIGLVESKIGLVEAKIGLVEAKMDSEIKTINERFRSMQWYIVTTIAIVGGVISLVIAFK